MFADLIQIVLWFTAVVLVTTFSLFATSALRLSHKPAFLICVYLFAYADIALVGEIAGLIGKLDSRSFYLIVHVMLAAAAYVFWRRAGAPHLLGPLKSLSRESRGNLLSQFEIELYILSGVVVVIYLVGIYIILTEPQAVDDVLTTYLARVGYWLQSGSFAPWPTSVYNLPQLVWPHNASLQLLWSVLFWGSDQLAGAGQWLAVPVTMLSVYGLSLFFGANRSQSLFVALLWALFPIVILQSTQALTDLIATGILSGCIYLLFLGLKTEHHQYLWLSGLAFGLVIGTRQNVFFALPGFAIVTVLYFVQGSRTTRRLLAGWIIACAAGSLVFGLPSYFYNMLYFGHPLGPAELAVYYTHTGENLNAAVFLIRGITNVVLTFVFAVLDGFTPPVYKTILGIVGIPPTFYADTVRVYSYAWYGLPGFLLVAFALIHHGFYGRKNTDRYGISLIMIAISYSGIILFTRHFTESFARYLLPAVTMLVPLATKVIRERKLRVAAMLISIPMIAYAFLFNGVTPLVGVNAIGTLDRIDRQTCFPPFNEPQYKIIVRTTLETVPVDGRLGIMLPDKFPQFPLFGEDFSRTVIQYADPYPEHVDADWLKDNNLDYLLLDRKALPGIELSDDLEILTPESQYLLIRAEDTT
jgi:4-amino-4-deoxy-L-arabinose transferase-like glycosyltransferase